MINGLWQSAAGLQNLQARQAILSNNLANVDTAGFKPDTISFRERLIAARSGGIPGDDAPTSHPILDRMAGGVTFSYVATDFARGAIMTSGNPLDVALDGDGFLSVRTPRGTGYTRDGRLTLRSDGTLVTAAGGLEVLDEADQPIVLDRLSAEPIQIDTRGEIRQGAVAVGKLGLADFADKRLLTKSGNNLFSAGAAQPAEARGEIRQFAYEASGADPIAGMVGLIENTRAYQLNASMITIQDETLGRAVSDIGKIG